MKKNDTQVNFRMPEELKSELEKAARENGRSLTAEIVARLQGSFDTTSETEILNEIKELRKDFDKFNLESFVAMMAKTGNHLAAKHGLKAEAAEAEIDDASEDEALPDDDLVEREPANPHPRWK